MSQSKIPRRASVLALMLLVATGPSPALAGSLLSWPLAWEAARELFTPWLGRQAGPRPPSKRSTTIGPDGVRSETLDCLAAGGSQAPATPQCGDQ
jgi:hypothetical protein